MLANEQVKRVNVNRAFYPKAIFGLMSGFISAPMGITGAMMNTILNDAIDSKVNHDSATIVRIATTKDSLFITYYGFAENDM